MLALHRVATVREKHFQGQGKVREFCKRSGKILVLVKVSEKSGNFVFVHLKSCEKHKEIKNEEKNILMVYNRGSSKCKSRCSLFDHSPNDLMQGQ